MKPIHVDIVRNVKDSRSTKEVKNKKLIEAIHDINQVRPVGEPYFVLSVKNGLYTVARFLGKALDISGTPEITVSGGIIEDIESIVPESAGRIVPGDRVLVLFYGRDRNKAYIRRILSRGKLPPLPRPPIVQGVWSQMDGNPGKTKMPGTENQAPVEFTYGERVDSSDKTKLAITRCGWNGLVCSKDRLAVLRTNIDRSQGQATQLFLDEYDLSTIQDKRFPQKTTVITLDADYVWTREWFSFVSRQGTSQREKTEFWENHQFGFLFYDTTKDCYTVVSPEGLHHVSKNAYEAPAEVKTLKWPTEGPSNRQFPEYGVSVVNNYACRASWPDVGVYQRYSDYKIDFFERNDSNEWKYTGSMSVQNLLPKPFNALKHRILPGGKLGPEHTYDYPYVLEDLREHDPGNLEQRPYSGQIQKSQYTTKYSVRNSFIGFDPSEGNWIIPVSWDEAPWTALPWSSSFRQFYSFQQEGSESTTDLSITWMKEEFKGFDDAALTVNYVDPKTREIKHQYNYKGNVGISNAGSKTIPQNAQEIIDSLKDRKPALVPGTIFYRYYITGEPLSDISPEIYDIMARGQYDRRAPTMEGWIWFRRSPYTIDQPAWDFDAVNKLPADEGIGFWGYLFTRSTNVTAPVDVTKHIPSAPLVGKSSFWQPSFVVGQKGATVPVSNFIYNNLSPESTIIESSTDPYGNIYIHVVEPTLIYNFCGTELLSPFNKNLRTLADEWRMKGYALKWTWEGWQGVFGPNRIGFNYGVSYFREYLDANPLGITVSPHVAYVSKLISLTNLGEFRWSIDLSADAGSYDFSIQSTEFTYEMRDPLLGKQLQRDPIFINRAQNIGFVRTHFNAIEQMSSPASQVVFGNRYFFVTALERQNRDNTLPDNFWIERPVLLIYRYFEDPTIKPRLLQKLVLVDDMSLFMLNGKNNANADHTIARQTEPYMYGGLYVKDFTTELKAEHVHVVTNTDNKNGEIHNHWFVEVDYDEKVTVKSYYANHRDFDESRAPWGFKFQNIALDGTGRVFWLDKKGRLVFHRPKQEP